MKKKLLIILPISLLLLAAIYLFAVPAFQANAYKEAAKSSQLTLATSVGKAISAANQEAFSDEDVTSIKAKNAIKVSKDAISELETKLQSNEKSLTSILELPFVFSVNQHYRAAIDLKSLEEQYVKSAKDYLEEFKAVNKYNEETLPAVEAGEEVAAIFARLDVAESEADALAGIDQLISKLDGVSKIVEPIKPAESVKEMHEISLNGLKEITALAKQLRAAFVAMDVDKLTTPSKAMEDSTTNFEMKSKKLAVKLIDESKLAKLGNKLNDLNNQIDLKTAAL